MLTADLVRGRVQGGRLSLQRLDGPRRIRAIELAEGLLSIASAQVGGTREELHEAWGACVAAASERKLVQGLTKLVEDAATFTETVGDDAADLRREVFLHASVAWRAAAANHLAPDGFERAPVLAEVATARGITPEAVEAGLYADLRGAQTLVAVARETATALVERYERACVQAVLLRAVRVEARVACAPAAARTLFHKLKFHRLLHTIERAGDAGYRITIDGPYSLFDAVTRYGLELALVLPALEAAGSLELTAELKWGSQRRPIEFNHSTKAPAGAEPGEAAALGVDALALLEAFRAMETPWEVAPASEILDLPGVGLVVPDLRFRHPELAPPIFLEVLGFWSRAAVWRRVELVEAGLRERILFAVSSRLRVSEEVLADRDSAALCVFKGSLSARAVERKLEALRRRPQAR